jgi:hypothetical protein
MTKALLPIKILKMKNVLVWWGHSTAVASTGAHIKMKL